MIFVNDKKYACETCIKGHRSSSCQHTERALFEIKKKGRPVTQCDHCRELRKTKQVHVRCSCETKPDQSAVPKQPGKKGSRLPAEAAYPNGLSPSLTGVATSPAPKPVDKCTCGDGQTCHCCVPRKKNPPSGHTPPPGHSPNNPHPHVHHQHAYAPYTRPVRHQMMYRIGPCACGTNCVCPDCAQHRQNPHSHSNAQGTSMNQPFQGHGGDPCPVRCGNCFDCAGGLTLLLDPSVQSFESEQFTTSNGSFVSSYSQSQTYLGQPNGIGSQAVNGIGSQSVTGMGPHTGNGMGPTVNVVGPQVNVPQSNGAVPVGAPAYYPPPDVEMDEFNAAMAGLEAGIAESSPSPSACGCPPGQCTCNHQQTSHHQGHGQGDGNYWDRPRCGFAVSTERGGCCDGMVSEVGSEMGVGSDAGLGVGSDGGLGVGSDGLGVGSDAGIGSDAGSVVGGPTNLSMDFADLGFGGLELPPMQYDQRFSGEYYRDSGHFSHHRADSGQFTHHRESSQFSNHSNLSLPSSIDSASVSLASLASSHGISSLASSHGIPSLQSSHGIITPHSSPLSGRITPNRQNGRLTPHAKPTPRGYRRILPKVAAMTNHRPFRRHPRPQPSLHAVMESDVNPAGVSPGQSQVLLQGGQRVRGSVRAHLPIVGKYFQPGGRYEPSRFRNAQQMQQMQAAMQQAGLQPGGSMQDAQDQMYQHSPQSQSLAYSAPPSESDYDGSYSPQYADEEAFGSFAEEEEDMYNEDGQAYEYPQQQQQQQQQLQQQYGFQQAMGQYGGAEPGPAYQTAPMPVRQSTLVPQSMAVLPVQAPMIGGMAYASSGSQYSVERPSMSLQHSSSTAGPDDAPPSPKQKVSSGLGMPHTMSLPTAAPNAGMSGHNTRGTLDDVDIKPGLQPKDGQGPGGKKSRWPSFSVHGHRVMVGAKVMGAAYATR